MADEKKEEGPGIFGKIKAGIAGMYGSVAAKVKTPPEILFFILIVLGLLTVPAASFIGTGPCTVGDRSFDTVGYTPAVGSVVVNLRSVEVSGGEIAPGACGIIMGAHDGSARVLLLARPLPFYTPEVEDYDPLLPLEYTADDAPGGLLFLNKGVSVVDLPLSEASPVRTFWFTDRMRAVYLNWVYTAAVVLAGVALVLSSVGWLFKQRRMRWYDRHTLRGNYRARLFRDKERFRELRELWGQVDGTEPEKQAEMLNQVLDGVLALLGFEGDGVSERLRQVKHSDLSSVGELRRISSALEDIVKGEYHPPLLARVLSGKKGDASGRYLKRAVGVYKESLVLLGFLKYGE